MKIDNLKKKLDTNTFKEITNSSFEYSSEHATEEIITTTLCLANFLML